MPKLSTATVLRAAEKAGVEIKIKVEPKLVASARLDTLIADYLATSAKLDQLKAKKDQISEELEKKYHGKYGPKIQTDEYLSTLVPSHNASINKMKLLQLGVRVQVIEKATVKTPYTYVRVSRLKDEGTGEKGGAR